VVPTSTEIDEVQDVDPQIPYHEINDDVIKSMLTLTWKYWLALGITLTMVVSGFGLYYWQTTVGLGVWGTNDPTVWGVDIPGFIYWIGLSHSGTLLSAILLITNSNWRKPIYRSAEAMTFFAVLTASIMLLVHLGRPWRATYMLPIPTFRQLWPNFQSALAWDFVAITTYMTMSGLFLFIGTIPDFAAARDKMTGWRHSLYKRLALGWKGTDREWKHLHRAYVIMGVLLVPLAASVHSVVAWDWNITNVPGFHSTIFAPFFVAGAIYSGIAGVVLVMIVIRRLLHFEKYITPYHIGNLGKILFVCTLAWSYFTIMELMLPWYKGVANNFELMTAVSKLRGDYAGLYWTMILVCGVIPLSLLSHRVRTSIPLMFVVAVGIEIGMFLERFIIIVPGLSTSYLPAVWSSYSPTWVEIGIIIWTFSIFTTLFLVFVKIVPPVSIYEVKELLRVPKREALPERGVPHLAPDPVANVAEQQDDH